MLFYSYFKTLVGKEVLSKSSAVETSARASSSSIEAAMGNRLTGTCLQVTVELKNDLCITGVLHSVDQYLNVKLENIKLVNETKYPHMVSWPAPRQSRQLQNIAAVT